MNLDFYTYNGFDFVVSAFTRVALLFSATNFTGLFISFAVLGIIFAGSAASLRGVTGNFPTVQSWFAPILLGMVIFKALMLPTGDIAVYDPVRNRSQVVNDVPQGVILVAGIFNLIERTIVDAIDGASAHPYKDDDFGISFNLLGAGVTSEVDIQDNFISKTITYYVRNCAPIAMVSPSTSISDATLKRGTDDLRTVLAGMALPALTTLVFDAANKAGDSQTCKDAWDNTIQPAMSDPTFLTVEKELCKKVGFDADTGMELTRCRQRMVDAMQVYGIAPGTFTGTHLARQSYLAQRISVALENDPALAASTLANHTTVAEGIGMYMVAAEWMPLLRGMMTAIAISMIPILTLFFVTPLASKAIFYVLGMFGWLTLWGTTDAILHDMAHSAAMAYWEGTKSMGYALDGIARTQEAAAQSMALMGKTRTYSIGIATTLAMALWRFGGYAFTQITDGWSQHLEQAGAKAGYTAGTPQGMASTIDELQHSMSTLSLANSHGVGAMANDTITRQSQSMAASTARTHAAASAGVPSNHLTGRLGSTQTAQEIGTLQGQSALTAAMGRDPNAFGNVQQTVQENAHTDALHQGAGSQAVSRTLSQRSVDGQMADTALSLQTTKQQMEFAHTSEKRQQMDYLRQQNPDIDDVVAASRVAAFADSNPWGEMLATGGDAHENILLRRDANVMANARTKTTANTLRSHYGDAGLGAADLAKSDTRQHIASKTIAEEQADLVNQQYGGHLSKQDAFIELENINQARNTAGITVAGDDTQGLIKTHTTEMSMQHEKTKALTEQASHFDLTPNDLAKAEGIYETATKVGNFNALGELPIEQLAYAAELDQLRHGIGAESTLDAAAKGGLTPMEFLQGTSQVDAANSLSRYLKAHAIAKWADADIQEAVLMDEGSMIKMAASGQSLSNMLEHFKTNDLIDDEQYELGMHLAASGETAYIAFSSDLSKGDPTSGNIRIFSGSQYTDDTSIVLNDSKSVRQGLSADEAAVWQAFTAPETELSDSARLVSNALFDDYEDNGKLDGEGAIDTLSVLERAMGTFGRMSLSDNQSSSSSATFSGGGRLSGGIQADSRSVPVGYIAKAALGVHGHAEATAHIGFEGSRGGTDTLSTDVSHSAFTVEAIKHAESALQQIDQELTERGLSLSSDNPVEKNQAEFHRMSRFPELFSPFLESYAAELQQRGNENADSPGEDSVLSEARDAMEKKMNGMDVNKLMNPTK